MVSIVLIGTNISFKGRVPMKKFLLLVLCAVLMTMCLTACGDSSSKPSNKSKSTTTTTQKNETSSIETTTTAPKESKKYALKGGELGDFGKEVVLNKNTDMPTTKYLYKLPAGNYKATTELTSVAAFSIVKDAIGVDNNNPQYPEVLQYSGEVSQYRITAGDNDFNGTVKKEYTITLSADESILIMENDQITFEGI